MILYTDIKGGIFLVSIDDINNTFERENMHKLDKISQKILDECHELIDPSIDLRIFGTYPTNILHKIKTNFIYNSEYERLDCFFKCLKKFNYNANREIYDAINNLSFPIFNRLDKSIVLKYLNSPYIDSIESTTHGFKIKSEHLGEYVFDFADHYYHKETEIANYIRSAKLNNRCHHHVEFLTKQDHHLYSVTSFCEHLYKGISYYHSYCWDKNNNKIIDLCSNIVMDKEQYDQLFKCEEIFQIEGSRLVEAVNMAKMFNSDLESKVNPIAATLFQQYIWENNFKSPDISIYSEEPKNPKLLIKNRIGSNN